MALDGGPDPEKDGAVRWRRIDLQAVNKTLFGVNYHGCYVGLQDYNAIVDASCEAWSKFIARPALRTGLGTGT